MHIHLHTPPAGGGYNHENRVRSEGADEAAQIDARIASAWNHHPRRFFIDSEKDFLTKAAYALELIAAEVSDQGRSASGEAHEALRVDG